MFKMTSKAGKPKTNASRSSQFKDDNMKFEHKLPDSVAQSIYMQGVLNDRTPIAEATVEKNNTGTAYATTLDQEDEYTYSE